MRVHSSKKNKENKDVAVHHYLSHIYRTFDKLTTRISIRPGWQRKASVTAISVTSILKNESLNGQEWPFEPDLDEWHD